MRLKRLKHKRIAEGEVTGHFHAATAPDAVLYGDTEGVPVYLDAPNGSPITHQEHDTINVPAGKFTRSIVQEFDPFAEEIREVRD